MKSMLDAWPSEIQKCTDIAKVHGPTNRLTGLFPKCLRFVLRLWCLFVPILVYLFHKAKFGATKTQEIYESRNGWSWKEPLEVIQTNLPAQVEFPRPHYSGRCPESFEYLPRKRLYSLFGPHVPVLNHSHINAMKSIMMWMIKKKRFDYLQKICFGVWSTFRYPSDFHFLLP